MPVWFAVALVPVLVFEGLMLFWASAAGLAPSDETLDFEKNG